MSTLIRSLEPFVRADLKEKMVFLGGPRQVGKTTFAKGLIPHYREGHPAYINWDHPTHRKRFIQEDWSTQEPLLVFDEIHKFKKWRNTIRGYWDTQKESHQFLITGCARLDYYRKGGDSLMGRYHYYRMHPLSLPEISQQKTVKELNHLLMFGGFPEPFLKGNAKNLRRWHNQRVAQIVSDDISNLEHIKELSLIELLMHSLPERVGSPLSRKNLAEELEVDFKTLERWLTILENVYYCYRISPYGAPKIRAVKKEQKLYLWDWSEHDNDGKKWENLVASHLLRYCHFLQDTEGHRMELRFLRDTDGREVDFVVLKEKKPIFAVECKAGESSLSRHIDYFKSRTEIPRFYQVHRGNRHRQIDQQTHLLPFSTFCELENIF